MTKDLINSAICDILSLFRIPTATIGSLWNLHCEKRLAASRDILFDEIEQGVFDNIADDDKISLMHRYAQAAMNGAAQVNLRLLAQVINSLAKGEKLAKPIYANEFNRYAQALETLSEEEIHLLASMYQYRKDAIPPHSSITPNAVKYENEYIENFEKHYRYKSNISYAKYVSLCSALLRTGLIYPVNQIRGTKYALSPFFDEIIQLVDFDDVFKRETQE